jgi:hypothetical protein
MDEELKRAVINLTTAINDLNKRIDEEGKGMYLEIVELKANITDLRIAVNNLNNTFENESSK